MSQQAGMFETELIEGQVVAQNYNELPPRLQKSVILCVNPRKPNQILSPEKSKIRKKLSFSNQILPTSFSLLNRHMHILGIPPTQSHGAEADCLALLRTTAALGRKWINWVKNNCYLFSNCQKMWV